MRSSSQAVRRVESARKLSNLQRTPKWDIPTVDPSKPQEVRLRFFVGSSVLLSRVLLVLERALSVVVAWKTAGP